MTQTINLVRRVLRESSRIVSEEGSMGKLINEIENKPDPDPDEVYLLEALYQYHEKLNILNSHLTKYVQKSNQNSKGSKLDSLYESSNKYGTSKLFD